MSVRLRAVAFSMAALFWVTAEAGRAQVVSDGSGLRAPQFLLAVATERKPLDVVRTPVLNRRIAIALDGVTLREALARISERSGLRLAFAEAAVPLDTRVYLQASAISVAGALSAVLLDVGVDVVFTPNGHASLVKRVTVLLPPPPPLGSISGRITTARTVGTAVSGARVSVDGTPLATTTETDGRFRLDSVPAGNQLLHVAAIGYEPGRLRVDVPANGTATADLRLTPRGVTLDELVVTGTAFETRRRTIPSPLNIITTADIEQKGSNNIVDLLRGEIPGIVPMSLAQWDFQGGFFARGNGSTPGRGNDVVKIFIDGVEIASYAYMSTIDPSNIERIEVVRGAQASTIYGAGAMSGTLQIFTKKGSASRRPEIMLKTSAGVIASAYTPAGAGTPWTQDHSASITGGSREFSYRANVSYLETGEWIKHYNSNTLGLSASARAVQGPLTVDFSALWSRRNFDLPVDPLKQEFPQSEVCPECGDPDRFFNFKLPLTQSTMGITLSYQATPRWKHNLIVGDDQNFFRQFMPEPNHFTPADTFVTYREQQYQRRSLRYNTAYDLAFGRGVTGRFTLGADYLSYDYRETGGALLSQGLVQNRFSRARFLNDSWWNAGVFGMAEMGFGDQLFLTLASRVDENSTLGASYGRAVSPRVGVSYVRKLGAVEIKGRAGWGKSVRPPPGTARGGSVAANGSATLPNPNLGPEEKTGWDAGLELYFGRHGSLTVTRYDEDAENLIMLVDVDLVSNPRTQQFQNVGRVDLKGWEIEGSVNAGPVTLRANYAYIENTIKELSNNYAANPFLEYQVGDRVLYVPRHSGGATLTARLWRGSANLNMSMRDNFVAYDWRRMYPDIYDDEELSGPLRTYWKEYPAIIRWNVGAEQALSKRITAFMRVDNLTNNQQGDFGSIYVGQGRTTMFGARLTY